MVSPGKPTEVKLAVIEVKLDGLKSVGDERAIKMEAHIIADAEAFKAVMSQLDVLKAFRWQIYGALIVIGAILGAAAWIGVLFRR